MVLGLEDGNGEIRGQTSPCNMIKGWNRDQACREQLHLLSPWSLGLRESGFRTANALLCVGTRKMEIRRHPPANITPGICFFPTVICRGPREGNERRGYPILHQFRVRWIRGETNSNHRGSRSKSKGRPSPFCQGHAHFPSPNAIV